VRSLMAPSILLAASLVTGCADTPSHTSAAGNPAPAASLTLTRTTTPVVAEPADAGALVVSGPIIVEHQVDVMAQRDGVVKQILFDTPSRVKAGTLLAKLDDHQIAANLEAARAKTRSIAADLKNWEAEAQVLQADYVRAQRLWNLGLIAEEQLEHAKYKAEADQWDIKRVTELLNNARAEEQSLELELEKTKIVAPFEGLIARRYVREGQSVGKGERLFWVTAEAPLLMRFTLPEKAFGQVHRGEALEITSADAPGEKHSARIKEISPVVDPASGTFEVLVELMGSRGSLRPGMTASARLEARP
jgi:RND family efflux transporter MFP subunit